MTKKSTKMCFTKQVIGLTLEIETTAKLSFFGFINGVSSKSEF